MSNMKEVWKDIVGFEGLYQVSDMGKVKSLGRMCKNRFGYRYKPERIMSQSLLGGYSAVGLYKNGKQTSLLVHRLVAISFIPNPENKKEVNHIDLCKTNPACNNLEWCTKQENMNHAKNNGAIKRGEDAPRVSITNSDAINIIKLLMTNAPLAISRKTGISKSIIAEIYHKRNWKHLTVNVKFPVHGHKKLSKLDIATIKNMHKLGYSAKDISISINRHLTTITKRINKFTQ